jgi:hypothetical protein
VEALLPAFGTTGIGRMPSEFPQVESVVELGQDVGRQLRSVHANGLRLVARFDLGPAPRWVRRTVASDGPGK